MHRFLDLSRIRLNDVQASSTTAQSKSEKGFKFYVLHLCNFEGTLLMLILTSLAKMLPLQWHFRPVTEKLSGNRLALELLPSKEIFNKFYFKMKKQ